MKRWIPWLVIAALLVVTVVKLAQNKRTVEERMYRHDKSAPVHVGVDTVRLQTMASGQRFGGTVVARNEGRVMAEVPGRVVSMDVSEGQWVERGAVIARLDGELLRLQQEAARITVQGLEKDEARYRILAQADAVQGVQLEKTEQALEAARVQLANMNEQLRRTTISAPFSGQVMQLLVEVGSVVGPSAPVAQLSDHRELEVLLQVSEQEVDLFREGAPARVSMARMSQPIQGTITHVGRRGDTANRFTVRIDLPGATELRAGLSASVQLPGAQQEGLPTIPTRALVGSTVTPEVYLVRNGKAHRKAITTVSSGDGMVTVSTGLKAGDVVITSGFISITDGSAVTIQ